MRGALLLALALLVVPSVVAQVPVPAVPTLPSDPTTLGPFTVDPNDPTGTAIRGAEAVGGTNLTQEDVRAYIDVDFRSLDFDAVGVVFGGGDFSAQGRLSAHLEFRAINLSRLQPALPEQARGCNPAHNERNQTNVCRPVLTAGEFRATLTGAALQAFEDTEAAALSKFLATTFPDATILNVRFAWSNVDPQPPSPQAPSVPQTPNDLDPTLLADSREPPIVLDMTLDVQYLKRESLVELVDAALQRDSLTPEERHAKEAKQALLDEIRGTSTGAFYERSAFDILGIDQLLVIQVDPGWTLEVTLHLPKGYTYEYASPDVLVGPERDRATTVTLADAALSPVSNPVAVSLSNRFLVATALTGAVLLVGALLRFPTMLVATRLRRPPR